MFAWFEEEFDMSPEEVLTLLSIIIATIADLSCVYIQFALFQATALMGAHSLGRARRGNSGYNGQWTPGRTNVFDNEFYTTIYNDGELFFLL